MHRRMAACSRPSRASNTLDRLAADPASSDWAVVERATGIPAGTVLLKPLPDGDGEIEIGWHFHPDSWGRGLMEAAHALLARGFALSLDVLGRDGPVNLGAQPKIGMRLLGTTHRRLTRRLSVMVGYPASAHGPVPHSQ